MISVRKKDEKEQPESILRRFTRRVQQSGNLRNVRGNRFFQKAKSKKVRRSAALYKQKVHKGVEQLKKMGNYNEKSVDELRKSVKAGN